MLKLYREPLSPLADAVEGELNDFLMAYDRVMMDTEAARNKFGAGHSLPVLADNERVVSGEEPLRVYLEELRQLMKDWQAFQGDWCYVDEDGKTC